MLNKRGEEKLGYAIIGIVAIVAIVGLVILYKGKIQSSQASYSSGVSDSVNNVAGQAASRNPLPLCAQQVGSSVSSILSTCSPPISTACADAGINLYNWCVNTKGTPRYDPVLCQTGRNNFYNACVPSDSPECVQAYQKFVSNSCLLPQNVKSSACLEYASGIATACIRNNQCQQQVLDALNTCEQNPTQCNTALRSAAQACQGTGNACVSMQRQQCQDVINQAQTEVGSCIQQNYPACSAAMSDVRTSCQDVSSSNPPSAACKTALRSMQQNCVNAPN